MAAVTIPKTGTYGASGQVTVPAGQTIDVDLGVGLPGTPIVMQIIPMDANGGVTYASVGWNSSKVTLTNPGAGDGNVWVNAWDPSNNMR